MAQTLALVSISVARLRIALPAIGALKGQDLEVAPGVILHVAELVYALVTDAAYKFLH